MNVKKLIKVHVEEADIEGIHPLVVESILKPFAIDLLEMVSREGEKNARESESGDPWSHKHAIDKALEDLRK